MSGMRCKFCGAKRKRERMYRVNVCKQCVKTAQPRVERTAITEPEPKRVEATPSAVGGSSYGCGRTLPLYDIEQEVEQ